MGISGRVAAFFLRHSMTPLIALVAVLLGVFAVLVTPREEEPQINVTMANVFIPFPGASAKDVEALVARPAEQVLARISGIDHVYSVSRPGMAIITVQYLVGQDPIQALVRLYDTINSNRDWLSPNLGVLDPIIKPKGIDDVPIVTLTFWSAAPADSAAGKSAFDLQQVARAAEIDLKRIAGTRDVATIGGPGHVIRVVMESDRMNAYGITAQDLKAALQVSNASQPSGSLVSGNREVLVQTGTYLESAADVERLVVGVSAGKPVFMADVARIVDGADQPSRYVWFGTGAAAPTKGIAVSGEFPAVTLSVSKKPGVNAADVAAAVIARAQALKGTVIPDGVEFSVTRNYGETAPDKAQKLIGKLIFATAFVVLLVFFALGRREAVIVGLAVSLTLAATLFASWAWGFTLNRVSLFALIFSIGILVDDAIVVVENIHRWHLLEPAKPLWQIIPLAVDEVGGPTILATFTKLLGRQAHPAASAVGGAGKLERLFRRVLSPFLDATGGRRARRKLWLGVLIAILASVSLAGFKLVVLKMLPFDNKSEFQVVLDMPVGTPLEQTARVLRELGAHLATIEEVSDYQAYAGVASPINFNGLVRQYYLRANPEMGDIQVNLADKRHRHRQSHEVAVAVRAALTAIAQKHGGNLKVVEVPPGPPVLSTIVAEIYGPDYAGQIAVA
ncbi:MAG: efflux RND transporter permease subunit, partial [Proteobacteria bacterium]|nr:efflux RND transporter permease subunit [Pseudomonadota bacterium]